MAVTNIHRREFLATLQHFFIYPVPRPLTVCLPLPVSVSVSGLRRLAVPLYLFSSPVRSEICG